MFGKKKDKPKVGKKQQQQQQQNKVGWDEAFANMRMLNGEEEWSPEGIYNPAKAKKIRKRRK